VDYLLARHIDDFDVLKGFIHFIHPHILDVMNDFQPRNRTTKDSMLVIQPRAYGSSYEELRTVGVRTCIRH